MTSHRHSYSTHCLSALTLLVASAACNEYPIHDLGYINNAPPPPREEPAAPRPPVAEFASEFAGVWLGEAEDPLASQGAADRSPPSYRFPSGSSRIRLELSVTGDSGYTTGTLTFGDPTPPPPATDPNLGYPVDPDFDINANAAFDASVGPPMEGFPYFVAATVAQGDLGAAGLTPFNELDFFEAGRVVDGRLLLSYTPTEAFGSWCALQTASTCSGGLWWDEDTGECFTGEDMRLVDCQKESLCNSGVCDCSEGACTYSGAVVSSLTLRFSDDGLVGLFSGATFVNERGFQQPVGTVRFRREMP